MSDDPKTSVPLLPLSVDLLPNLQERNLEIPSAALCKAPETILQLGWGKFMRGFIPDFVQLANMNGHYRGRILAVQREFDDRATAASRQNTLYTLIHRGLENGRPVETKRVIGSVSRVLVANREWEKVEAAVRQREFRVILSNATETGLKFDPADRSDNRPPRSFSGKLTRLLFERWTFTGGQDADIAIIPTELVLNNGAIVQVC